MKWWLVLREVSKGDFSHYIHKWTLSNSTKKSGTVIKKNRIMNTRSNYEQCINKPCHDSLLIAKREKEAEKKEKLKNIEMKKSIFLRLAPSVHRCVRKELEATLGPATPVRWAKSLVLLYPRVNSTLKSKSSCNVNKSGEKRSSIKEIKHRRVCQRPSS